MGLLDYADAARKKLAGLLGDMPLVQMMQGRAEMPTMGGLLGALKSMPVFSPDAGQSAYEAALNIGPMGLGKIVYHGSPHKFDKFDASKIGTGEGAQAYGHGIYMADNPAVAKQYSEALSGPEIVFGNAVVKPKAGSIEDRAKAWIEGIPLNNPAPFDAAIDAARRGMNKATFPEVDAIVSRLEAWRDAGAKVRPGGVTYKADLPDEWIPKMLDWDKPLSQQPESVRNAIVGDLTNHLQARSNSARESLNRKFADKGLPSPFKDGGGPVSVDTWAGERLMKSLGEMYGPSKVSEMLRQKGIPGIRYLDGGSRGKGQGSYNYVVFPGLEDQVKILERNGVPLSGLLGGN